MLKRLPEPTINQLIDIAMTSLDVDDIVGASRELFEREQYQKGEFRDLLLSRLLQFNTSDLSPVEKERFRIIIYESNLSDSTNRRDIMGKHFSEIQSDASYYQMISQKAKNILDAIGR